MIELKDYKPCLPNSPILVEKTDGSYVIVEWLPDNRFREQGSGKMYHVEHCPYARWNYIKDIA